MSRVLWVPAAVVALGMLQVAQAQQATAPPRVGERVRENRETRIENRVDQRRADTQQKDHARKIENMDQFMVAWLTPGNEEEILLAKMAQQRSQNAQVKQFADEMIQAHSKLLKDLGKFGHVEHTFKETANVTSEARTDADRNDVRDEAVDAKRRANTPPADEGVVRETVREVGETTREIARDVGDAVRNVAGYTDSADACRMNSEIHRECLSLTQQELDKWQGSDFDQAYLGQQVGAHIGMLATLRTFERHATDEMRPLIQQAVATTQDHLNRANELMRQIERPATARRANEAVDGQK